MKYGYPGAFELLSAWWERKSEPLDSVPREEGIYRFACRPILLGYAGNKEITAHRQWFVLYRTNVTFNSATANASYEVFGEPLAVPEGFSPVLLSTGWVFDPYDFYPGRPNIS